MRIHATGDVEVYAAVVIPFLESEPCARNVLRWVIEIVRRDPGSYTAAPSFWWVSDGDDVTGAASMTPPFPLLVSTIPEGAASALVSAVRQRAAGAGIRVPGVNGPAVPARAVAAAWSEATGAPSRLRMTTLLHEADTIMPVPLPRGAHRPAAPRDTATLTAWIEDFASEAGTHVGADPRHSVETMVAATEIDVWEVDSEIVSMAGHRQPVAGVVRVGPVYTPPQHRTRGYARRLTADVSEAALHLPGVRRCMLFTDTANPVSNSIYRQAGYVARGEHVEMAFA